MSVFVRSVVTIVLFVSCVLRAILLFCAQDKRSGTIAEDLLRLNPTLESVSLIGTSLPEHLVIAVRGVLRRMLSLWVRVHSFLLLVRRCVVTVF